jgi:hypothetical protein
MNTDQPRASVQPDVGAPPVTGKGTPVSATPAWLAALQRSGGVCECRSLARGHSHRGNIGRCPTRQTGNYAVGRLYLLTDGAMVCGPCAQWREHRAKTTTVVSLKGRLYELGARLDCDPRIVYLGRRMTMGGWDLRAHPLANPFRSSSVGGAEQAVTLYLAHLAERPELLALIPALRGRQLGCWCPEGQACHARAVADLADGRASLAEQPEPVTLF